MVESSKAPKYGDKDTKNLFLLRDYFLKKFHFFFVVDGTRDNSNTRQEAINSREIER